jgi:phage N-6-adenine-methyltransferase
MPEPKHKRGRSIQDYRTPQDFLTSAKAFLGVVDFDIDLAADDENAVTGLYYTREDDALTRPWNRGNGWNWLNPPFANIRPWVERAYAHSKAAQTCMLLPAGVGSNWFSAFAHQKAFVVFLNGRITFEGCPDPYPKDLMLLLYSPYQQPEYEVWRWK